MGMFLSLTPLSTERQDDNLTAELRQMYAAEKLDNFRWISKIVATYSPYTLTATDRAPVSLYHALADLGERLLLRVISQTTKILLQDSLQKLLTVQFQLSFYSSTSHY